ncbi:Cytidylate kinase [hydrothermal vent metagenome]|uniref:(d)CMP kinase n=1 Tax=hydrothermal vent metagenome TaxID=652676 RepID=A0A3B1D335_9ZZZZ
MSKVIAIDGPAGAGKSTVAKCVAKALGFSYLDTGAMYRALTFKAMRQKLNLENEDQLVDLARKTTIDLENYDAGVKVLLDGQDISEEIRTLEVTNNTFYIARAPRVREIMVAWQQKIGAKKDVVTEGRDVTTVVFPNATYKFYMDASVEERTERRFLELVKKGKKVDKEKLRQEIEDRDYKDFSRQTGPLKKAEDAIIIETTGLSIKQVVEKILKVV